MKQDDYEIFGPFVEFNALHHIVALRQMERRRAWDATASVARINDYMPSVSRVAWDEPALRGAA